MKLLSWDFGTLKKCGFVDLSICSLRKQPKFLIKIIIRHYKANFTTQQNLSCQNYLWVIPICSSKVDVVSL
jgi:hypothetical protein